MRGRLTGLLVLAAMAAGGCSQAGMPGVSLTEAAQLGVGTNRIAVACGTADELKAFGGPHPSGLAAEESIAISGVRKLAAVFDRDQRDIYQGESVGAVVHDSIALLDGCGLIRARALLIRVLHRSARF